MSAPPTKRTISTTSPSARVVALYWALGTMSPFRSTATRAGSYPAWVRYAARVCPSAGWGCR